MDSEPLVPAAFVIGLWGVAILAFALVVIALFTIYRSEALSSTEHLIWTLIVIFLPFLGSILWFAYLGSKRKREVG
jgi:hypothetical protein